jgi:hypothetical protein
VPEVNRVVVGRLLGLLVERILRADGPAATLITIGGTDPDQLAGAVTPSRRERIRGRTRLREHALSQRVLSSRIHESFL